MTTTPFEQRFVRQLADRVTKAEAKGQGSIQLSTTDVGLLLDLVARLGVAADTASRPPLGVAEGRGK